jgi:hypothetical protein
MRIKLIGFGIAILMLLSVFAIAGVSATTPIAAGTHASVVLNDGINSMDAFGSTANAPWALTHKANVNGVWDANWATIGGQIIYSPVAATVAPGNVKVFCTGYISGSPYGPVWGTTYGAGDKWFALGGSTGHGPAACSWGSTRLDVFATGTDNRVYQKYSNDGGATWSGWVSLGGQVTSGPDATASYAAGQLQVSVTGINGHAYIKNWNGHQWSEWKQLVNGSTLVHDHPCMCSSPGVITVFAVDSVDGTIWYANSTTNYTVWNHLTTGVISSSPDAAATQDGGTIYFFGRGNDMAIWYASMNTVSGVWSGWTSIGGQFP